MNNSPLYPIRAIMRLEMGAYLIIMLWLVRMSSLSDINCLVQRLGSGLLRAQQCASVTGKVNTFPHSTPECILLLSAK
jgi:hypothetical protein